MTPSRRVVAVTILAAVAVSLVAVAITRSRDDDSREQPQLQRFLPTVHEAHPPAVAFGSVWITGLGGPSRWVINRLEPDSGRMVAHIDDAPRLAGLTRAGDSLWGWVVSDSASQVPGFVVRIDPTRNSIEDRVTVDVGAILGTRDALWIDDAKSNTLVRLDPDTGTLVARIRLSEQVDNSTLSEGSDGTIWVNGSQHGVIQGVDPSTNRVRTEFRCFCEVLGSAGQDRLWLFFWSTQAVARYQLPERPSESFVKPPSSALRLENVFWIRFDDGAFWWNESHRDVIHYADTDAVASGLRSGRTAELAMHVIRFTPARDSLWFVGWRADIGWRLYRWSPSTS
jgi:hypothetical protein